MSKVNKAKGNMYDWVTHTWSPMVGCPHQCSYCYVRKFRELPSVPRMDGEFPPLGECRTIFVGHMCDMWAKGCAESDIRQVLKHCAGYPKNTYVFQTKNPARWCGDSLPLAFPPSVVLGTTIETDDWALLKPMTNAPAPLARAHDMRGLPYTKFVTIEPILDFDVEGLATLIGLARPSWVNIGADSKGHGLPEPSWAKVQALIVEIKGMGIEIRAKTNLDRLGARA